MGIVEDTLQEFNEKKQAQYQHTVKNDITKLLDCINECQGRIGYLNQQNQEHMACITRTQAPKWERIEVNGWFTDMVNEFNVERQEHLTNLSKNSIKAHLRSIADNNAEIETVKKHLADHRKTLAEFQYDPPQELTL